MAKPNSIKISRNCPGTELSRGVQLRNWSHSQANHATAKPKPVTSAYCQTLKSASSRSACLKKVSAQTKVAPTKTAKAKTKKPTTTPTAAPKQPDSAQLAPPAIAPSSGTVAVPPLPQKTI